VDLRPILVVRGLDPRIHLLAKEGWIARLRPGK